MTIEKLKELPRCDLCNVPLGESNNVLYVEGRWLHFTCAFQKSVKRLKEKGNNNAI